MLTLRLRRTCVPSEGSNSEQKRPGIDSWNLLLQVLALQGHFCHPGLLARTIKSGARTGGIQRAISGKTDSVSKWTAISFPIKAEEQIARDK